MISQSQFILIIRYLQEAKGYKTYVLLPQSGHTRHKQRNSLLDF